MSKSHAQIPNHMTEIVEYQRALLDLLPAAAIVTRYDGSIIYVNERAKNDFGLDVGRNILDFYENAEKRQNILTAIRKHGFINNYKVQFRKPDGTLVWMLISCQKFEFDGDDAILSSLVNITGLQQTEEALRTSEEKFRTIFMVSSDGVFITNPTGEGKFIEINDALANIVGYTRDEIINHSSVELELFYDLEDRERLFSEVRANGFCKEREVKVRKKDGEVVICVVSIQQINIENEIYLMGVMRDITEHKRTEDELQHSKANLTVLIESTNDLIWSVDLNYRLVTYNLSLEQHFAHTYGSHIFIGAAPKDILPPERAVRWPELYARALNEGPYRSEYSLPNGHILELAFNPLIDDGKKVGISVFGKDITQHKRAEEALMESEGRFHSMFQEHGAVMFLIEPTSGQILDANAAAEQFYGYPIGALRKMNIDEINVFIPEEVAERRKLALDRHLNYFVFPHRLANGEIRTVEIHSTPIEMGGRPILFSIIHDVTQRVHAEENLARQVERLGILHTMEHAITRSLELKHILDLLAEEVIKQLRVDACSVLLLNRQTNQLEFTTKKGFHTKALKYTRLKIGVGLAGKAAQTRKIVHIVNLPKIANENPNLLKSIEGEKFVSYFGIPLIAQGEVLGVLEIFHRTGLASDADWFKFLATLADQAAIAIDNARLLEATQQNLKETDALYHINQGLIASSDAEDLMDEVVNLLQQNFGYSYVQIFVIDPQTGNFVVKAGSGEIGKKLKGYSLTPGEGIVALTAETGNPFFTNNVEEVISFVRPPLLIDTKSELAVPIKIGHQFIGLLDIHQSAPAYLTERDLQLVGAVADQLAVAIQKAELYTDLREALLQEQAVRSQLVQSEKLAVAGRLLASVSHELNNPIQAIQNALYLLKSEKGISIQGKQDLEIVLSETERMASMLQRLRTTYQPVNLDDFKQIQINDIIEDVCALVATHLRHSRISYEFHASPNLPLILGMDGQIRQVMLNLFMNAVDAMAEGGHLVIETQSLTESQEVLVTVSDNGSGIEPSILPNIFEAFVTNKERGSGLGLAISYEIILKHHGRITAENNPERGATFHIWLPVNNRGN